MEAKQEAKLNMYDAVITHCKDNSTITATIPAFDASLAKLVGIRAGIAEAAQHEQVVITGITTDKAEQKKSMCKIAADIAAPVFAFASTNGDNDLKQQVNFSLSDLLRSRDEIVANLCQNIHDAADDNLADLADYGITAAKLTALQDAITLYSSAIPKPRNATAVRKSVREKIKLFFQQGDAILKDEMDKTVVGFKADFSDFVTVYFENREIIDAPRSKTAFEGEVKSIESGNPVRATVSIVELNQTQQTNAEGFFRFKPVKFGTYTLKIEAIEGNFVPKTIDGVKIKLGQTTARTIELQPL